MNTTNFTNEILSLESNLSGFAYKLTRNYDDANDLVQDTYLKALTNQEKFNEDTNLKAWLCTIMKNTFINEYRRKSRRCDVLSSDVHEYTLNNKPAESTPEQEINYKELNSVVNSLEPEFRVPFQMYDSGFKYQEIADELGLNLGTIKSRIFFSRKKIMDKIENN